MSSQRPRRLLDQVRSVTGRQHCSARTERACLDRSERGVPCHGRGSLRTMRLPQAGARGHHFSDSIRPVCIGLRGISFRD